MVVASKLGITKQVLGLLNASSAYAALTDDDKFTDGLVDESVSQGDERSITAIAETLGHWARPDIMDWSADITANLSEVPTHIGGLGDVRIKYVASDSGYQLGRPLPRQEIEVYRRNSDSTLNADHASAGTVVAGYFDPEALHDGVCDFTGAALSVRVATYTRGATLQSPEAYSSFIAAHALSVLFTVDGLDDAMAAFYGRLAAEREASVRGNARMTAPL